MKKIAFYSLISILVFASSCRTKKSVLSTTTSYRSSKLFRKVKKSNIDYTWYSYKSNAKVYFNGTTVGGTVDVRIKKDKVIWMSIRKFGFEVARVLIRPDSVFAVDRLNGKYLAESYEHFKEKYDVPVDFNMMQDILAGNSITKGQKPVSGSRKGKTFKLKTQGKDVGIEYDLDSDFKISNSVFKNKDNQTIELNFSKYKMNNGKEISYLRKYSFPNSINPKYFLHLKIKSIKINKEQKLKFEIPKKYTKM